MPDFMSASLCFFFKDLFVYFRKRERERERVQRVGTEGRREREKISSRRLAEYGVQHRAQS